MKCQLLRTIFLIRHTTIIILSSSPKGIVTPPLLYYRHLPKGSSHHHYYIIVISQRDHTTIIILSSSPKGIVIPYMAYYVFLICMPQRNIAPHLHYTYFTSSPPPSRRGDVNVYFKLFIRLVNSPIFAAVRRGLRAGLLDWT